MLPCGFAAGIAGVLPKAGSCAPPCRRHRIAAAPISATIRAKMPDKLIAILPLVARTLAEASRAGNDEVRACTPGSGAASFRAFRGIGAADAIRNV